LTKGLLQMYVALADMPQDAIGLRMDRTKDFMTTMTSSRCSVMTVSQRLWHQALLATCSKRAHLVSLYAAEAFVPAVREHEAYTSQISADWFGVNLLTRGHSSILL